MMKKTWSRGDKIGVAGVTVAVLACFAAFFIPEGRRLVGLDKPVSVQAQTQSTAAAAPPPKSPTGQHTTTNIKGNSNVAGNNVAGNGNVVGNDNQVGAPVVNAPNGIAIGGGIVNNPTVNNFNVSPPQVKQETLALAADISKFIAQQRKAGSPPSWQEFVDSFGDRIVAVSDKLASAGLNDFWLQQTKKVRVSGDIAGSQQQVADTLVDLGSLLPQDGLYQGVSNDQLAHAILEQADKIQAMSDKTLRLLIENNKSQNTNPNFIRSDLFFDFNRCCRTAVKDLRGLALQRLPGAVDENETLAFLTLMHMKTLGAFPPMHEYIPYLKHLAAELQTHP